MSNTDHNETDNNNETDINNETDNNKWKWQTFKTMQ